MKPRRTPSSNLVYRLDGHSEDHDLWATVKDADEYNEVLTQTVWQLDDDERRMVAEGANICLTIWGTVHPPTSMEVGHYSLGKDGKG